MAKEFLNGIQMKWNDSKPRWKYIIVKWIQPPAMGVFYVYRGIATDMQLSILLYRRL